MLLADDAALFTSLPSGIHGRINIKLAAGEHTIAEGSDNKIRVSWYVEDKDIGDGDHSLQFKLYAGDVDIHLSQN